MTRALAVQLSRTMSGGSLFDDARWSALTEVVRAILSCNFTDSERWELFDDARWSALTEVVRVFPACDSPDFRRWGAVQ